MKTMPYIKYTPTTWAYMLPVLKSFGYKVVDLDSWDSFPCIVLDLHGKIGEISNLSTRAIDKHRIEVDDPDKFLAIAAELMGKVYTRTEAISPQDLCDDIQDFPPEIVGLMLLRQAQQGNTPDITVFQVERSSGRLRYGFTWSDTPEGPSFWADVLSYRRFDIFFSKYPKQRTNTETKEFKVVAPEGYEIDRENSTLDCIKFKRIKTTYKDIAIAILNKPYYYINADGEATKASDPTNKVVIADPNNSPSAEQLEKILALNMLMNTAKYLNDGAAVANNNGEGCWAILLVEGRLETRQCSSSSKTGLPRFKTEALAKRAIDILGEMTVKMALTSNY